MNLWSKFKKLFEIKCDGCGELPSRQVRNGRTVTNYICKCDAYKMACSQPIRSEKYMDDYGVNCVRLIYAVDIYPEDVLKQKGEDIFKSFNR